MAVQEVFLDEFNGTGPLQGRFAPTGHLWDFAVGELDGTGWVVGVESYGSISCRGYPDMGLPFTNYARVQLNVDFDSTNETASATSIRIGLMSPSMEGGYELSYSANSFGTKFRVWGADGGAIDVPTDSLGIGVNVLSLAVDLAAQKFIVGVNQTSYEFSATLSDPLELTKPQFIAELSAPRASPYVPRFDLASVFADLETPGLWWTNIVRATETP